MEFRPMSPDEMNRTMQFLLSQQAQFAANLDKLEEKTNRLTDAVIGLTGIVGRVAEAQERLAEQAAQQKAETERRFQETNAWMADLGEYIKEVGSHLDVVVRMFERHLAEGGGPRPS